MLCVDELNLIRAFRAKPPTRSYYTVWQFLSRIQPLETDSHSKVQLIRWFAGGLQLHVLKPTRRSDSWTVYYCIRQNGFLAQPLDVLFPLHCILKQCASEVVHRFTPTVDPGATYSLRMSVNQPTIWGSQTSDVWRYDSGSILLSR